MAKKTTAAAEDQLIQVDPKQVDAGDNAVRFGTLRVAIDALKASILAQGRINDPVEGEMLSKGHYKLTVGFGRHQAVTELNAEGAGLLLPMIVRAPGDAKARIVRQLSENVDRKSLSPMDQAVAIRGLLDTGYTKPEIRALFARPGGRKGNVLTPASNAWLNMTLSFLDLPKTFQTKIHEGLIGVAAAYELTKVDPGKREEVLKAAEARRLAEIEKEEKAEAKLSKAEEKLSKAEEKHAKKSSTQEAEEKRLAEAEAILIAAEEKVQIASANIDARKAELKEIGAMPTAEFSLLKPEEKKIISEKIGGAKVALREAEKALGDSQRERSKAQTKLKAIAEKQEKKAAKQAAEPEAPAKKVAAPVKASKPRGVGSKDVKVAAAETGASQKAQPATVAEVRKAAMTLGGSKFKGARAVGAGLLAFLDGKLSVGSLVTAVEVATGERQKVKA